MPESSREEIAKLEALYANNPDGRVFTHLAEALRKAGELDRARSILEDGLLKHPTYASAHVVLGRVLMDHQQSDEAAEAFRKVLTLDPHNMVALRSLGDLARAGGRNQEAIGYYEQLKHHDPSNTDIDALIEELSASASAAAAPAVAQAQPDEPALGNAATTEPPMQAEPASDAGGTEPVSGDLDLDWVPDVGGTDFDSLPGDLGTFAAMSSPAPEPLPEPAASVEPEPEPVADLPTFALPEEAPLDLGGVAEEAEAPEAFEELPTFEEPPAPPAPLPAASEEALEANAVETPVTETIAELYTAQGLHDQAADVYRALLRERPGDANLEARLAAAEASAKGGWESTLSNGETTAFEPTAPEALEPEAEPESEAWIAGAAGTAASAPTPYAWTEQSSDSSDVGPPVSEYFRKLLSWRPAETQAPQAEPAAAPDVLEDAAYAEPFFAEGPAYEDDDTLLLLEEAVPVEEPASEPPPPLTAATVVEPEPMPWDDPTPLGSAPAAAEPEIVQESVAPAPAEVSPPPAARAPDPPAAPTLPPAPPTPSSATTAEAAFDEWFGGPEPEAAAPPPAAETSGSEEPGGEDDDDLEMFRSWLQSLKK